MALVKRLIYVFKATAVKGVIKSKTCLRESVIYDDLFTPHHTKGGGYTKPPNSTRLLKKI